MLRKDRGVRRVDNVLGTASPESRFVLSCLAQPRGQPPGKAIDALLVGPMDLAKVLWIAQRQRVVPRLQAVLSRCDGDLVPAALMSPLRRAARVNALGSLRQLDEVKTIGGACRSAGFDALFSATSLLGFRLYRDPACFQAGTVELLCAEEQVERVVRLIHDELGRGVLMARGPGIPAESGAPAMGVSLFPLGPGPGSLLDPGADGLAATALAPFGVAAPDDADLFRFLGAKAARRRWRTLGLLDQLASLWAQRAAAGTKHLEGPNPPLLAATLLAGVLFDAPLPPRAAALLAQRAGDRDEEVAGIVEELLRERPDPAHAGADSAREREADDEGPADLGEFVPTPLHLVEAMLELAEVSTEDVCCDLGCGEGRILIEAAARRGCRCVGYDLDADLIERAGAAAREAGVADRVRFVRQDVRRADLSGATVLFSYLRTRGNRALLPRFRQMLKRGTRIVTRDFHFGAWPPARVEVREAGPADVSFLYLWRW